MYSTRDVVLYFHQKFLLLKRCHETYKEIFMYTETAIKILTANALITLPGSKTRKGPALKGWSKFCSMKPSKSEFTSWKEKYPHANICLPLGEQNKLVAIDIDFNEEDDPILWNNIMEILPKSAISKIGSKGLTFFYKFNNEISESLYYNFENGYRIALEILSSGKATDLPPSIHPKTQKPYRYTSKKSFEHKHAVLELPILSPDCIKKLKSLFHSVPKLEHSMTSGRNDKLKKMTLASLNNGKSITDTSKEIFSYDKKYHSVHLFSDESEFSQVENPILNAETFVKNIKNTLDKDISNENSSLKVISLEELLNSETVEMDWLASELLLSVGTSLLIAGPKMGKSQLSRNLALAVADGKQFLGRNVKQGKVLIVLLEEYPDNLKSQIRLLNIKNIHNIKFITKQSTKNCFLDTLKYIENEKPQLVIIDTLAKFFGCEDINNYSKVISQMEQIEAIAHKSATHIMMIHHSRKGGGGSGDDVLGSQALFSSVDTLLTIHLQQGVKDKVFISSKQRYSNNDFKEALLVKNDKTLTFSFYANLEEYNEAKMASKIRKLLKSKSSTEQYILKNITGKTSLIKSSLNSLFDKGIIIRSEPGVKGKPYEYSLK